MERKILCGPGFCAVTEDGELVEYLPLDDGDRNGCILLGRVGRLMPGLKCAFIDIGRKKNGFLPLDEISGSFSGSPVRSGETLILQVKKEENGEKGAFLTRDVMLAGSLAIVMPMNRYVGVSSRITDPAVRQRLKETGEEASAGKYGIVMRNAAADAAPEAVKQEAESMYALWQEILEKAGEGGAPGRELWNPSPAERLKADYRAGGFETVELQGPDPEIVRQLKQSSERTLRLPGGGNIVIDRCEAMTVIDVNTASAAGAGSKEMTVLQTNLEACGMIARQVRLRNLGGIILIDFIDMEEEADRDRVLQRMSEAFANDRIKTVIHGWTKLGILEMTRKRTGKEIKNSDLRIQNYKLIDDRG